MTAEEMQQLLSKSNNAIVAVNRPEGGPQLTPVWYAWDGTSFYFSTTKDRAKYPNIRRDPNISLVVDDFDMHKYVVAYGRAEIIEHDFADLVRPVIKKYVPADRVEQAVKAVVDNPKRVLVVLRPDKIVTN
ncbi:MAG TPA: PPOX class F420-dependent oxidoreductase [Ktedonobacteraceae bacterium]|jgi:PPOX class probable F420-dependent enzyme|nr:PPOX class F420-dependent oxidoreductase [Ktedonobacteraceae bacterium]